MPHRVVGVLHGQRRPLRGDAVHPCLVRCDEIPAEGLHRLAVTGNVVQEQEQYMLVIGRLFEECGADGNLGGEVESVPGGTLQTPAQLLPRRHLLHVPRHAGVVAVE
nr:hypothetical protein [Streptomyces tubbatahanensis]